MFKTKKNPKTEPKQDLEQQFNDHRYDLEQKVLQLLNESEFKPGPQEGFHWDYIAIHAPSGIKVLSSPKTLTNKDTHPTTCCLMIPGIPDTEFGSKKIKERMQEGLKKKEMVTQTTQFHAVMSHITDALKCGYAHREAEAKKKNLMNKMIETTDPKYLIDEDNQ